MDSEKLIMDVELANAHLSAMHILVNFVLDSQQSSSKETSQRAFKVMYEWDSARKIKSKENNDMENESKVKDEKLVSAKNEIDAILVKYGCTIDERGGDIFVNIGDTKDDRLKIENIPF